MQKTPRLQFTDAELETPALQKPIRKVQKMAAKADKAQEKIPKKTIRRRQYALDPETGQLKKSLHFEEVDKARPSYKLNHAVRSAPGDTILARVHKEIQKSEEDNVGVESAHKLEETAEAGGAHRPVRAPLLRRRKLRIIRFPASGKAHSLRCSSFSHKVCRLCGNP